MAEETEVKAPCGAVFPDIQSAGGHTKSCPLCQMLKRDEGKKVVRKKTPPPSPEGKVEETDEVEGDDDEKEAEYVYPGPGPARLKAILLTNRYPKSEAVRLTRAFANNRWAWTDWNQLLSFLVMHQVPHNIATSVATEYFGVPAGGGGMPGQPFGVPGMPYGAPPPGIPYGAGAPGYPQSPYYPPPGYPNYTPYPHYPPPPSPPAERQASDGSAAAAISAFGDITKQALEQAKAGKQSDAEGISGLLAEFSQRMEERIGTLKAIQDVQQRFDNAIAGMKDAQMSELQRRHDELVARLKKTEERNPVQDFKLWRDTVEGAAKEMGYVPPGSQDIYGAMSNGFKEINETLRAGLSGIFHREPKDTGLEERRKQAEVALTEDRLLKKALEAARRASERKHAQEVEGEATDEEGERPPEQAPQQAKPLPQRPSPRLTAVSEPGNIKGNELRVSEEEHEKPTGSPGSSGVSSGEGRERGGQASQPRPYKLRTVRKAV